MAFSECENGHIYDTQQYTSCPYCKNKEVRIEFGTSNDTIGKTAPISMGSSIGKTAPISMGSNIVKTVPVSMGSNIGKTVPYLREAISTRQCRCLQKYTAGL